MNQLWTYSTLAVIEVIFIRGIWGIKYGQTIRGRRADTLRRL